MIALFMALGFVTNILSQYYNPSAFNTWTWFFVLCAAASFAVQIITSCKDITGVYQIKPLFYDLAVTVIVVCIGTAFTIAAL